MIRTLIWNAFLIALPFIIYAGYVAFVSQKKEETGGKWDETPYIWLLAAGVGLMMASLVFFALTSGEKPGTIYKPVQIEDNKTVPYGEGKP